MNQPRRLPAEWERQSAVMLTWPHAETDWAPLLAEAESVFLDIAEAVCRFQQLLVACHDHAQRERLRALFDERGIDPQRYRLHLAPSNDSWVRDHGPISVYDEDRALLLDFQFNGWGRKFEARLDNALSGVLHAEGAFGATPLSTMKLILEGGSIESDGLGTLLTTRRCLLSPERNPQYDCVGLEGIFAQCFGTHRVLWLDKGELEGDDTDAHIDTLARFCDERTIAYVSCDDEGDSHYGELKAMEQELAELRTETGEPYRLIPLPLPAPAYDPEDGHRLPATYANFLIINGAVLVPTYNDPLDGVVLERLAGAFPEREMVAIDARALIRQHGSIHCVTMQLPHGVEIA